MTLPHERYRAMKCGYQFFLDVFDEEDNLLEMRPFRDRADAEEYAELFEVRS